MRAFGTVPTLELEIVSWGQLRTRKREMLLSRFQLKVLYFRNQPDSGTLTYFPKSESDFLGKPLKPGAILQKSQSALFPSESNSNQKVSSAIIQRISVLWAWLHVQSFQGLVLIIGTANIFSDESPSASFGDRRSGTLIQIAAKCYTVARADY